MAGVKGRSGTNKGQDKAFTDALRLALYEADEVTGKRKLRRIAEKLVEAAMEGEAWAIQQVADRLDGKPAQAVSITATVQDMTDDELQSRINQLASQLGSGSGAGTDHPPGREEQPAGESQVRH